MPIETDDLRIVKITELSPPAEIMRELPRSETASAVVRGSRAALRDILRGATTGWLS